jgi:CrcB protein
MSFLIVGVGGILGSITRYLLSKVISRNFKRAFPFATFFINISGAFLLGIVSTSGAGSNIKLLLADGFLGAYTTFSTFMYEGFNLFKGNKTGNALVYISASITIGILGFISGASIF